MNTKFISFLLPLLIVIEPHSTYADSLIFDGNDIVIKLIHSQEAIHSNSLRKNKVSESDLFLDLSKSKFAISGQRTSNKIILQREKMRLGTFHSKSSLQAHIKGAFVGNLDAVFSDFSTQTSVNLDQESVGVIVGKEMFSNNNFSGNLDLLISKTDNSFTTTNSLEVGFVEFEEKRVENFSSYEIGYQTNSNFYLSEKISMSLLSSRSKTFSSDILDNDIFGIGIEFRAFLDSPQLSKEPVRDKVFKNTRHMIEVFFGDGAGFISGDLKYKPDDYEGSTEYKNDMSINGKTLGIRYSWLDKQKIYSLELENFKKDAVLDLADVSSLGGVAVDFNSQLNATFIGTILYLSAGIPLNTDKQNISYISIGPFLGQGILKTKSISKRGSTTDIENSSEKTFIGGIKFSNNTIFKINKNQFVNFENAIKYIDGNPFGVSHKLVEFESRISVGLNF
ncbi:hypothetical protein OAP51_04935 [Alphaproteobacteria bacterium]|nr:hypothetical protein [Alphaproteobacteria bacterium]